MDNALTYASQADREIGRLEALNREAADLIGVAVRAAAKTAALLDAGRCEPRKELEALRRAEPIMADWLASYRAGEPDDGTIHG